MWGDLGGRDKEIQVLRLSRVERHRLLVGPRRERRPEPRRGPGRKSWAGGLSSRTGLRCQGPAEQSPDVAGRRREGLVLPLLAHLWHRQNKGWEGKQEEILTGAWEPKQQVPTAALQDTAGLGQESRARHAGLPFLSLCPTALTLPHDALQPPFRHRRRHLPKRCGGAAAASHSQPVSAVRATSGGPRPSLWGRPRPHPRTTPTSDVTGSLWDSRPTPD